jgi:Protein of unknown function (DUF3892)
MPSRHEIHYVNRSDRFNHHERIRSVAGVNADGSRWTITQQAAVEGIESGKWRFYIKRMGRTVEIIVADSKYGSKYLKTLEDGLHPDTLLALPAAP